MTREEFLKIYADIPINLRKEIILVLENNMSEKNIKKNFRLSEDFNSYAIKHPEIFKRVPEDACIVMTERKDPRLTKENIKMAKEIIRKERKPCFKAVRKNRKWMLESISV